MIVGLSRYTIFSRSANACGRMTDSELGYSVYRSSSSLTAGIEAGVKASLVAASRGL